MAEAGAKRDLDVVVLGATGVTGKRVAAYLADRAPEIGSSWAAAGRSRERIVKALGEEGISELPELIEADVADPASLTALAERARVVLNLVGPYTRYGEPVIAACAAAGTHYFDLSGEIPFVARMTARYDSVASESGAKLIQVAGFEALPTDLAALRAAEVARERFGEPLAEIDAVVTIKQPPGRPRASDGISGGTFGSLTEALADPDAAAVLDAAALLPPGADAAAVRARSPIKVRPRLGKGGSVIAPMAPAPFINPAVIHRTNALVAARDGQGLGPRLRYREGIQLGRSYASLPFTGAGAGLLGAVSGSMALIARAPAPVRSSISRAMRAMGPEAGYGPRPERLETWSWRFHVTATTEGGHVVELAVEGDGHPGYLTTARMLGEAGLILADPASDVPDDSGSLTPATALGTAHLDRFARAGLRFIPLG